jgi:cardiolipin synthase (CMP-forming)
VTIPNFITLARLIAVPLIVWLMIADRFLAATVVFVLAGVSDGVDGFIAKRYGQSSDLGAYLDPLADKAMLVFVFLTLGFQGLLPAWLIVTVVSRDILIIGGVILAWMLGNPIGMKPLWVSKANTVAQIVLVALALGERAGLAALAPFIGPASVLAGALTALSAAAYLRAWLRHMAGGETIERGTGA